MIRRRRMLLAGAVAVVVLLSILDHAGFFGYRGNDRWRYDGVVATVTRAFDGDTLEVDLADGAQAVTRIRLWGVDSPELAHAPDESDAYFGREAADTVQQHVVGRPVRIALDPNHETRDRYGRLLAYLFLEDSSITLNEMLVERGLAYADPRYPNAMKTRLAALEKEATRLKAGLWAGVTLEKMPGWRQRSATESPR